MPTRELTQILAAQFQATTGPLGVTVPKEMLLTALRALRDTHGYRYYVLATGVEADAALEVVHAIRNLEANDTLFVRVSLPKEAAEVDSAAFVYAGAEWHEREIFDLFGITFRAHPDLRRLLMPDDYPGHPLRKSFAMDTPWGYRP